MSDLDIIRQIEKELDIVLAEFIKINYSKIGFSLNRSNSVTSLCLWNSNIGNLNRIIFYLKELVNLRDLTLSLNNLADISCLQELNKLTRLALDRNQINDITSIGNMHSLTKLYLDSNKISDINPLSELTQLIDVSLVNNYISDISALKNLKELKHLGLIKNKLEDISTLAGLQQLKFLSLGDNPIDNIDPIKGLINLQALSLSRIPIKKLPEWITNFKMGISWADDWYSYGNITFFENPIESPPIEIIQHGKQAIRNYYLQLGKEMGKTEYLFEAKVLVIGEGGTGKTTFKRKLQDIDAEMPQEKDTTLGIEVDKWSYKINFPRISGEANFHVNLWDFGGQKIYQGTHQIFFSEKSCYVLIADTREQKTDFSYWLNTVEQLGGDNSSLIIVLNKKFGHEQKFDESGFRNHFGKVIKDVVQLDLSNDKLKLHNLQDKIKMYLAHLPGIGDPLPPSWVNIREDLLKENQNFISFDRFREICKRRDIGEVSMIYTLSEYFNRIGAFTHYINDPLLQERIYLNSNWLVKTVYKVLDNDISKSKKGRLSENEIKKIWGNNELHYEVNKLTQLMHKFGLMYHIPKSDNYVVPAHLPTVTPYEKWPYSTGGDILQFIYEFDKYMPQGIMSRLIVALNHHIKDHNMVWHRGLNIELAGTYAEIIESYGGINRFEIRITGGNKIELLTIIRERFAEVLKPFNNLNYKQLVPCICDECKSSEEPAFHDYSLLLKFREKGRGSQCSKTGEIIIAEELLKITGSQPKIKSTSHESITVPKTVRIFLASSKELEIEREQFEIFINRENKKLNKESIFIELNIWEDFIDAMSNSRLQDEYNKLITECDIFLSMFFTKVGKYTIEEFEKAFYKFKTNARPFIYTYFKDAPINTSEIKKADINTKFKFEEKLKKLGHFPTIYKDIDDLKYQFKMQLEKVLPLL